MIIVNKETNFQLLDDVNGLKSTVASINSQVSALSLSAISVVGDFSFLRNRSGLNNEIVLALKRTSNGFETGGYMLWVADSTLLDNNITVVKPVTAVVGRWIKQADFIHTIPPVVISWTDIQGKPAEFPTLVHTTAKISDFAEAVDARIEAVIGEASEGAVVSWNDVINKPTTFTPATHSHDWASITGKPTLFTPQQHNVDKIDDFVVSVQALIDASALSFATPAEAEAATSSTTMLSPLRGLQLVNKWATDTLRTQFWFKRILIGTTEPSYSSERLVVAGDVLITGRLTAPTSIKRVFERVFPFDGALQSPFTASTSGEFATQGIVGFIGSEDVSAYGIYDLSALTAGSRSGFITANNLVATGVRPNTTGWRFKIDTPDGVDNNHSITLGFLSSITTDDPDRGAYLRVRYNGATTTVQAVTSANSGDKTVSTLTPLTAGWHTVLVDISADGTVIKFYIDGSATAAATHTTSLLIGGGVYGYGVGFFKTSGTAFRRVSIDTGYYRTEYASDQF